MTLPAFLVAEMRFAFKTCAQQHKRSSIRFFNKSSACAKKVPSNDQPSQPHDGALTPGKSSSSIGRNDGNRNMEKEQTELTAQEPDQRSVETGRKVPVPMKVIPKAQVNSQMTLTPRQRLHIEIMTRRPPPETKKKIYRERIQIYHMGSLRENMLAVVKVSSIVTACAVSFVFAPAHISAGTATWIVALIWLGGFVPGFVTHYMTKGMVNRIFLNLPEKARESPKAVMEYARNLPGDALIDIRYLQLWGLEGSVKASTSELVPTKGKLFSPLSFTWKKELLGKRDFALGTPRAFFVEPKTASGQSSRDTIPGIWETVYKQIMKDPTKEPVKWQSRLEPYET